MCSPLELHINVHKSGISNKTRDNFNLSVTFYTKTSILQVFCTTKLEQNIILFTDQVRGHYTTCLLL